MISRLTDTPFLSKKFIEDIENYSIERLNFLLKDLNCDPMNFLETLLIDDKYENYSGIHLIINYGVFLTEDDFYEINYSPIKISMKRRNSLEKYLDKLNFHKIEEIVFSYFSQKNSNNFLDKNPVFNGMQNWINEFPKDIDIIMEYKKTKCLDKIIERHIQIKRKYIYA